MIVIKDKSNVKITYPIEEIASKNKLIFFDIETTGFSRKYCCIYLIGCMYFIGDTPMYTQWLAENFNDEANVLMAFHKFLQKFDTIVHFNGNSFDIPFLKERGEKYRLDFNFDKYKSIDLYKPVSKINHILKMENQKQKTFEKLLGIKRTDPFSGGDLIEVFKQFVESKDDRLVFPLLLHNKEDVCFMGALTSLLAVSDIFDFKFSIDEFKINTFKDINEDIGQELNIVAKLDNSISFPISYNYNGIYFKIDNDTVHIVVKIKYGTYKYFFENYKDYYYLPLEDRAMHKSVAEFVDRKYRKQASASTCYEKRTGSFLPIFQSDEYSFSPCFKEDYKDKNNYIELTSINENNIYEYCCMIIDYIKQKPK